MEKIKALSEDRDITTDDLKTFLKEVIDHYGFAYLSTHAINVYSHLPKERPWNRRMAGALLLTLLNGIPQRVKEAGWHLQDLAGLIREECLLAEITACELAKLYLEVFSEANRQDWEARKEQGFVEFCESDWMVSWQGMGTWYIQNVHVDCEARADIVIRAQDAGKVRAVLAKKLRRNPFMTAREIHVWFAEKLRDRLDEDFQEYVQAEEYYPPVAEDYETSEVAERFCKEYGFGLIFCEESGSTSNYEPNF